MSATDRAVVVAAHVSKGDPNHFSMYVFSAVLSRFVKGQGRSARAQANG